MSLIINAKFNTTPDAMHFVILRVQSGKWVNQVATRVVVVLGKFSEELLFVYIAEFSIWEESKSLCYRGYPREVHFCQSSGTIAASSRPEIRDK